ncbi:hypothetical protein ACQ4PT_070424 [Festuca glaucescens]
MGASLGWEPIGMTMPAGDMDQMIGRLLPAWPSRRRLPVPVPVRQSRAESPSQRARPPTPSASLSPSTPALLPRPRPCAMALPRVGLLLAVAACLACALGRRADAAPKELKVGYYAKTCPGAEYVVREAMARALAREARCVASVMRLQFHDCFVNGCDGSVLMDATPTMPGEKEALSNINSLRSFEVVDQVKAAVEEHCPGVVSCADIIIMASRDAVVLTGGPHWDVKLGREDSLTASQEDSDNIMPSPRANATALIRLFAGLGLSVMDLVALSGSHSIGEARCFSIMFRLYNQSGSGRPDPHLDPAYRATLDALCPLTGDQNVSAGMDATPVIFDNQYFKDLVALRGFLNSDQTLFSDNPFTRAMVERFSRDQDAFFRAFADGMVKMGDLQNPRKGEIRANCRVANGSPLRSRTRPRRSGCSTSDSSPLGPVGGCLTSALMSPESDRYV